MPRVARICFTVIITALLCAASSNVLEASPIVYYGSNGSLAASASFDLSGSILTIVLTNISNSDVLVPSNVLTGLGFNSDFRLDPSSASLNAGSSVYYNKGPVDDPGVGWGYGYGVDAMGMNSAISASGAVKDLGHSNFSAGQSKSLGGLDYGILSLGDDPLTGNRGVTTKGPLFNDSLVFTLNAPDDFTLDDISGDVSFFYGTKLGESTIRGDRSSSASTVPEPGTFALFGTGIGLMLIFMKRRLRRENAEKGRQAAQKPNSID
jgi:hypothetical protein